MQNEQTRPAARIRAALPTPRQIAVLLAVLAMAFMLAVLSLRGGYTQLEEQTYPEKYGEYVEYYAGKYALDPLILYAVIRTESGFDPNAQSGVDARGLMQITEETFDWIKSRIAPDEPLVFADLYDPETNVRFGSYYFACCLDRYAGDLATAAAAYHSGWGTVDRLIEGGHSLDGETLASFPYPQMERYVKKVTGSYARYQQLYPAEDAGTEDGAEDAGAGEDTGTGEAASAAPAA